MSNTGLAGPRGSLSLRVTLELEDDPPFISKGKKRADGDMDTSRVPTGGKPSHLAKTVSRDEAPRKS